MKVKLVVPDHARGMIDPQTKRSPFVDADGKPILGAVEVPDNSFWTRRVIAKELVRIEDVPDEAPATTTTTTAAPTTPTGSEPVKPLTTRG